MKSLISSLIIILLLADLRLDVPVGKLLNEMAFKTYFNAVSSDAPL